MSQYVALASLELEIYRPLPPLCCDEKYALTTPDFHIMVFFKTFWSSLSTKLKVLSLNPSNLIFF